MYTPQFAAAPLGGGLHRMREVGASHQCWSSAVLTKHMSTQMLLLRPDASGIAAATESGYQYSQSPSSDRSP